MTEVAAETAERADVVLSADEYNALIARLHKLEKKVRNQRGNLRTLNRAIQLHQENGPCESCGGWTTTKRHVALWLGKPAP